MHDRPGPIDYDDVMSRRRRFGPATGDIGLIGVPREAKVAVKPPRFFGRLTLGKGRSVDEESQAQHLSQIKTHWSMVFQANHGPADARVVAQRQLMQRYGG